MNEKISLDDLLVCPETKQSLKRAQPELLSRLNAQITQGSVKRKDGASVNEPVEDGLLREDGKVLYPIKDGIPIMLIEEGLILGV